MFIFVDEIELRLPANANPMARPRFELKYELTAINDDGFMKPNPNPNINENEMNKKVFPIQSYMDESLTNKTIGDNNLP